MYGRILSRIAVVAATVGGAAAVVVPAAQAATTTHYPTAANARTFAVNDGGWTAASANNGLCLVVCQMQNGAWQTTNGAAGAGDGFQRASFSTGIGVAVDQTVTFTSPSFTVGGQIESATLKASFRTQMGGLLGGLLNGNAKVTPRLLDQTHANDSVSLPTQTLANTSGFATAGFAVPSGALVSGRTYKVQLSVNVTALAAAAILAGTVDVDDVSLDVVDLEPPTIVTTNVNANPLRVCGTVDPHGLATNVSVEHGATAAYGTATSDVVVTGTGAQAYCIPLVGLTSGGTYHFRVKARNGDGTVYSVDATFVVPAFGGYEPPSVVGRYRDLTRTVIYDRVPGTTSVQIEVLLGDNVTVYSTTADADLDGSATIVLPATDGVYFVRVIRVVSGQTRPSNGTDTVVDRVGPVNGGAPVVTGLVDNRVRHVQFVRAPDAMVAKVQVLTLGGVLVDTFDVSGGDVDITLPDSDAFYLIRVIVSDAAGNDTISPATTVQLARGTRGTGGEDTPAPDTGTGGGGGGGNTTTTTTTTTVVNGDPGGWGAVLTSCFGATKIALTDVRAAGRQVRFAGIAAVAAGTAVTITDTAGKAVATTTVGADGRFAAVAKRPKAKVLRTVRYTAAAGAVKSAALKFKRIALVNSVTGSGQTVTITGKLDPRALKGKRGFKVAARGGRGGTACAVLGGGKLATVGKAKLNTKTGTFTVKVKVPGTGRLAVRVAFSGGVKTATLYTVR